MVEIGVKRDRRGRRRWTMEDSDKISERSQQTNDEI